MNGFDMRTMVFSYMVTNIICVLFVVLLWRQNRHRFAGTAFWVVDFVFQAAALFLIVMRGAIPDWISIVLANTLVIAGAILGFIGLERFLGKKGPQIHNYLLVTLFIFVHSYFSLVQPNLEVRNLNLAVALLLVCFQSVWLAWRRIEPGLRSLTFGVGAVNVLYCLLSSIRIAHFFTTSQDENNYFRQDLFEALILVSYQVLFILLTYSFVLMVNKRLLMQIGIQEEKFAKAFHSAPYAITLTRHSDGTIIDVNETFGFITGYDRAEVLGKKTIDLQIWERDVDRDAFINALSKTGGVRGMEMPFQKKGGERITGLFSADVITIDGEKCILSSIGDITGHRQADAALITSEARNRAITQSAHDAIITSDSAGNIAGWNRGAKTIFGYSESEVMGQPMTMLMPERYRDRHLAGMSRIGSGGEPHSNAAELHGLRKDRSEFPLELSLAKWETTDCWFITGIIRDITERKRAEGELHTLSRAVEQSPTSIVITNRAGNIEYVNPHFEAVTGYTKAEMIGRNPRILKSGITPAETYRDLWKVISNGDEWRGELCNRRKSGELFFEYAAISGLKDENGEVRQYVAVKQDITERKRAEEALQLKRAMLLKTERELVTARESLADSARLESVGRLAAGVAHEVKNPLMIIRLGVDYLSKQFPQEGSREVLDDVRGAVDRADNVIKDLLDFAKPKQFARRPTDINQVIDKAIHLVKHEIKRRNIAIVEKRDAEMQQIYADPDRLVQVFVNLLSNATQAIGKDGSIEVVTRSISVSERDLERSEGNVFSLGEQVIAVDIMDDGPGFATEHEKKLFEPFFTTKPVGEGSGLGLAVSRNIIMMHRGSIDISNRSEGGASALVMFRVAREQLTNE